MALVGGHASTFGDNRTRGRSTSFRKSARASAALVNVAAQSQMAAANKEMKRFTRSFHFAPKKCTSSFYLEKSGRKNRLVALQRSEEPLPAGKPIILFVERHDHGGRAAHDLFAIHRSPVAGIKAIVAVVAHHEVLP